MTASTSRQPVSPVRGSRATTWSPGCKLSMGRWPAWQVATGVPSAKHLVRLTTRPAPMSTTLRALPLGSRLSAARPAPSVAAAPPATLAPVLRAPFTPPERAWRVTQASARGALAAPSPDYVWGGAPALLVAFESRRAHARRGPPYPGARPPSRTAQQRRATTHVPRPARQGGGPRTDARLLGAVLAVVTDIMMCTR